MLDKLLPCEQFIYKYDKDLPKNRCPFMLNISQKDTKDIIKKFCSKQFLTGGNRSMCVLCWEAAIIVKDNSCRLLNARIRKRDLRRKRSQNSKYLS